MRRAIGGGAALLVLLLAGCTPTPVDPSTAAPRAAIMTRAVSPSPSPSSLAHSIDDPSSIWVVVNKVRPLRPADHVPGDLVTAVVPGTRPAVLRKPAARALERLFARARADGVALVSLSPYRPYDDQKAIYERNLQRLGERETDRLTARPGYSEHQTGLAADLGDASGRCRIQTCFGRSEAGRWLAANAWRSGWVLRYPRHEQHVTGIQWEPWHYRYVGTALATRLHDTGTPTLEQWFGLPDAPHYR